LEKGQEPEENHQGERLGTGDGGELAGEGRSRGEGPVRCSWEQEGWLVVAGWWAKLVGGNGWQTG